MVTVIVLFFTMIQLAKNRNPRAKKRDEKRACNLSATSPESISFVFAISSAKNSFQAVARTPRGPTLRFRVQAYTLHRDIHQHLAHPKPVKHVIFNQAPLVLPPCFFIVVILVLKNCCLRDFYHLSK
jgi:hypothetical protein